MSNFDKNKVWEYLDIFYEEIQVITGAYAKQPETDEEAIDQTEWMMQTMGLAPEEALGATLAIEKETMQYPRDDPAASIRYAGLTGYLLGVQRGRRAE